MYYSQRQAKAFQSVHSSHQTQMWIEVIQNLSCLRRMDLLPSSASSNLIGRESKCHDERKECPTCGKDGVSGSIRKSTDSARICPYIVVPSAFGGPKTRSEMQGRLQR
jgi:hypothetical protein